MFFTARPSKAVGVGWWEEDHLLWCCQYCTLTASSSGAVWRTAFTKAKLAFGIGTFSIQTVQRLLYRYFYITGALDIFSSEMASRRDPGAHPLPNLDDTSESAESAFPCSQMEEIWPFQALVQWYASMNKVFSKMLFHECTGYNCVHRRLPWPLDWRLSPTEPKHFAAAYNKHLGKTQQLLDSLVLFISSPSWALFSVWPKSSVTLSLDCLTTEERVQSNFMSVSSWQRHHCRIPALEKFLLELALFVSFSKSHDLCHSFFPRKSPDILLLSSL